MNIVSRIKDLCEKENTTLTALEKELNIGKGIIRRWASSSPNMDNIQKVADYFRVSTDYLLGREPNYNFYDFKFSVNGSHQLTEEDKQKLVNTFKDIASLYLHAKKTR